MTPSPRKGHPSRAILMVVALLGCCLGAARADQPARRQWTSFATPPAFEHISVEQGLSQSTVYSIVQDRKGFLWFGTDWGLNRYDGFHFQVYHEEQDKPGTLSGDRILHMMEDHRGYIWITTRNKGITLLNPETMALTPVPSSKEPGGLPARTISSLTEDREGNVWLGTEGQGLYMLPQSWKPGEKLAFQAFPPTDQAGGVPAANLTALFCDSRGTLWMAAQGWGLARLVSNPGSGKLGFEYFYSNPAHLDTSAPSYITTIAEDSFGWIWLAGEKGPYTYDPVRGAFQQWTSLEGESATLGNCLIQGLLRDRAGTMWLAADGMGLVKVLPRSRAEDPIRFQRYVSDIKDPRSLSGNGLQCMFEDRSGVLWVSAYRGGLNKLVLSPGHGLNRERPSLVQYRNRPADAGSLSGNTVAAMGEDKYGNLWIGTDGSGLNRVLRPAQPGTRIRFERFREDPRHGAGSLQTDVILTAHLDPQQRLWLGSYNAGLIRVDQASATARPTFTHYKHDPKDPQSLSSNFVRCIVDDGAGGFWVAFNDTALNHFDPRTGKAKRYGWGEGPKLSNTQSLFKMVRDAFGTLWIATPLGLNRFNPATEEFRNYKTGGPHSLSTLFVNTLYLDASGTLWVGTGGGGLCRMTVPAWDGPEPRFTTYGAADGLPGVQIEGILPDGKGNLWISSDRALGRFNIQEGKGYPLTSISELQKAEFIWNACFVNASGEMLFGSNDGLTVFHPDDFVLDKTVPPVAITGFQILDQPVSLEDRGKPGTALQEITLGPQDSRFSFDFAALHFAAPRRNQYAYMLEGLDKAWIEIGNKHSATYTTLPPGDYVLRVKASNCDGIWNQAGLSLKIRILPPWYRTWWFQSLLGVLLASTIYAFVRLRLQVLRHRNQLLKEEVEKRTQELARSNLELAEANEALLNQSLTDPLTGLRNRRFLYASMTEDIAQVHRIQREAAANAVDRMKQNIDVLFLMVDLDHFKHVNDHYGHHAGDLVLQQMSEILRGTMRESDIITRWGGEEFLIVARNTARADAAILPERVRAAVEAHPFDIGRDQPIHCHCSLGFSVFPFLPGDLGTYSWEQVVDIADACLYTAKRGGRNAWVGIIPDATQIDAATEIALPGDVAALIHSRLFQGLTSLQIPIPWEEEHD